MKPAPRIRAQYVAPVTGQQVNPKDFGDEEVVHYSIPSLQETGGPVVERASSIESNKLLLAGGEVIVSRLNPHKNCTAIVANHEKPILASTEFIVFHPADVDRRFLHYSFCSQDAISELSSRAASATRSHARVDPSDIAKYKIFLPPIEEQIRISDFLDGELQSIDALVEEKRNMLMLLEEKRIVQVSRAVTRGIDPRVPTRDSSYHWLGEIPRHWKTKRSKQVLTERNERSEEGEEELLTVSHLTGVTPRSEKDVNMFEAESTEGYKLVSPDNLVINTLWAWMGAMGHTRKA